MIKAYRGEMPQLGTEVFVEQSAQVIGRVSIGDQSSVWFNAVIRGDVNTISVGDRTNVQDGTVIHITKDHPTAIGNDVTIGHNVTLHGCEIGSRCLIGMGAVVLDGAVIGDDCIIGAGALVAPGTVVPSGMLAVGSPARVRRELKPEEKEQLIQSAQNYIRYKQDYLP